MQHITEQRESARLEELGTRPIARAHLAASGSARKLNSAAQLLFPFPLLKDVRRFAAQNTESADLNSRLPSIPRARLRAARLPDPTREPVNLEMANHAHHPKQTKAMFVSGPNPRIETLPSAAARHTSTIFDAA